jgi:hypothetical protein
MTKNYFYNTLTVKNEEISCEGNHVRIAYMIELTEIIKCCESIYLNPNSSKIQKVSAINTRVHINDAILLVLWFNQIYLPNVDSIIPDIIFYENKKELEMCKNCCHILKHGNFLTKDIIFCESHDENQINTKQLILIKQLMLFLDGNMST